MIILVARIKPGLDHRTGIRLARWASTSRHATRTLSQSVLAQCRTLDGSRTVTADLADGTAVANTTARTARMNTRRWQSTSERSDVAAENADNSAVAATDNDDDNAIGEDEDENENNDEDDDSAATKDPARRRDIIFEAQHPDSVHPALREHIRCGISGHEKEDRSMYSKDTGMSICFLGTSAGNPTKVRSTSSTLLRMGGTGYLFDVGEGTQRQMFFARSSFGLIEQIFITHMHGDHVFGLPSFLLGLQNFVMTEHTAASDRVIKIYGPAGLFNFVACSLTLSCSKMNRMIIEVYELVGTRTRPYVDRNQRNPFLSHYPEFKHPNFKRYQIQPKNGIWTIEDFEPKNRSDVLTASKRDILESKRRVRIKAGEVRHVRGVPTFGYVVEEEEPSRNIDPEKARSLNVSPAGKKYELLKHGFSVYADDGETEIMPEQVLLPRTKVGRKVSIVGDNSGWSNELRQIVSNSDVLVHEATLLEEDKDLVIRGHSTASMAGTLAADCNAAVVALTHISSRVDSGEEVPSLRFAAEEAAAASSSSKSNLKVMVANDFTELLVPREGFHDDRSAFVRSQATVSQLAGDGDVDGNSDSDDVSDEINDNTNAEKGRSALEDIMQLLKKNQGAAVTSHTDDNENKD